MESRRDDVRDVSSTEHEDQGFTLVEILAAVVIIGILAAFAVFKVISSINASHDTAAKDELATIGTSEDVYRTIGAGSRTSPESFGGLSDLTGDSATRLGGAEDTADRRVNGNAKGYIAATKSKTGNTYWRAVSLAGNTCKLVTSDTDPCLTSVANSTGLDIPYATQANSPQANSSDIGVSGGGYTVAGGQSVAMSVNLFSSGSDAVPAGTKLVLNFYTSGLESKLPGPRGTNPPSPDSPTAVLSPPLPNPTASACTPSVAGSVTMSRTAIVVPGPGNLYLGTWVCTTVQTAAGTTTAVVTAAQTSTLNQLISDYSKIVVTATLPVGYTDPNPANNTSIYERT